MLNPARQQLPIFWHRFNIIMLEESITRNIRFWKCWFGLSLWSMTSLLWGCPWPQSSVPSCNLLSLWSMTSLLWGCPWPQSSVPSCNLLSLWSMTSALWGCPWPQSSVPSCNLLSLWSMTLVVIRICIKTSEIQGPTVSVTKILLWIQVTVTI